jgi:hypothetical protein
MSRQADSAAQTCNVWNLTATSEEVPLDDEGAGSDGEAGARTLARSSGGAGAMRPPDHRARRAWLLLEFGRGPGPEDDETTRKAVLYLHLRQSPKEGQPLPPSIQDTAAAFELHQAGGIPRWHLEARLLTGVSLAEVGRLCGLAEAVVQAYADLFFDVLTSLEAEDFISLHAIGHDPNEPFTPDGPGAILKLAAYQGGPVVLEAVLQSLTHLPVPPEEYGRLDAGGLQAVAADLRCRGWMLTHSLPLSFFATGQVKVLEASLDRLRRCAEEMAGGQDPLPAVPCADVESVLDSLDLSPTEQRRRA